MNAEKTPLDVRIQLCGDRMVRCMKQQTYNFFTLEELHQIISTISNDASYICASGVLMQLYNPRLDIDEEECVRTLNTAFPKACITGITAANIAGEKYDISDYPVQLSVTYFKETSLVQYDFDMDETTSFVAGRKMHEYIESLKMVKCLQIFYTSLSIPVNTFISEFSHHHLPVFGVKAGRSIRMKNTAHVYGRKVYANGFVVVVFLSDSLKLYMDNSLGWKAIGVEMVVTKTNGDNNIAEIDKKPAIDIYTKYLKVRPNQYFVENVCEFPLIIERAGFKIARVPAAYGEDGSIYFTSDVQKGDHFRLAYATRDQLLSVTTQSAEDLEKFKPEAIYLFECGNRLRFLQKYYLLEIDQYKNLDIQLSVVTGFAEVFVTADGIGGDLNSTLVAVGLKEDEKGADKIITSRLYTTPEEMTEDSNEEIPFVDRILAFLESTSHELDSRNKELGRIAYTDQLTRIYNRWELGKKIDECLELNRQGKPYGLLFFDIDHFKRVNDTYGHDVGDTTLQAVANMVKDKLEPGHGFGRWGGEEFVYLVPDVDEKGLFEFAESIRRTIDEICFLTVQHITISIGATMARYDDTVESFVKRADDAVYEAKETGRNKVVLH